MVLREHASLSLCGAAALYLATADASAAAAFWVAGTLVDVDHLVDYWRDDGFNLRLARFFAYFPGRSPVFLLLPFHAWEWVLGLLAVVLGAGAPLWVWGLAMGWLSHLLLDQRFNPSQQPLAYWFAYRWNRGFRASEFYDGGAL
ncbi:MAG TPA: hypothetical protein VK914_09180 [bacterium]|jgi:hypothetical protein|nr:hypothetical protein [bacterium]